MGSFPALSPTPTTPKPSKPPGYRRSSTTDPACEDQAVTTAIVSDLHLGAGNDSDLLRRPDAFERLLEAIGSTERLVLLGDVIELRDRPLAEALELAAPVLRRLREAAGELVIVPGNHDHRLVSGWLEQRVLAGEPPLGLDDSADLGTWPLPALGDALGGDAFAISYPGVW